MATHGFIDRLGNKSGVAKRLMRTSRWARVLGIAGVVLGWALVAYLVRRIANAAANGTHTVYDPFSILGLATSATEREIKRQYRKLSIQFHPDKLRHIANQTREDIDSHYIELTKAYKSLTDDTIRKNLELYGHPDGRQEMSMGIALPTWVVESQNNAWVLSAYALVLGLALPALVARWWYGTRARTKDGVLNTTALAFFSKLKPSMGQADVFALLGQAEELTSLGDALPPGLDAYTTLEDETCALYKRLHGTPLFPASTPEPTRKALVLLAAYLHRVPTAHPLLEDATYTAGRKAATLLTSILAISSAHKRLTQTQVVRDMIPCVVQAVPAQGGSLAEVLQLPHMTLALAESVLAKDGIASRGLQGLWKVPDAERRALLVGASKMDAAAYEECMRVLGEWPRIELVDVYFTGT